MRTIVILILCAGLILINLSDQANGFKKKKVLKKIKDVLPLMLALKPRKKILLLPIPFPMKGKGKLGGGLSGNYLSALRNMRPFGNLMDSGSSWGSEQNYGSSAGYMMVPAQIQAPPPPPPPPQPIKYMMVPMPMPEFTPQPQPIIQKPSAPIMHQPAYSQIDQLNNQMMNQAMDTWMMMAAMDCFGMDNHMHSHGEPTPNIVSDKIQYKEPAKQTFYRSPAQIVRETPSKTAPPPPPPPPPAPAPEPVVQAPVQQTYHYEPIQRPVTQNDDSSFDHEPEPIKGDKLREYPSPQQQPVQQQQNHGGQTYFPTSDFGTGNRFVEPIKSSRAPIKGGY